jgi:hypothetical protein
MPQSWNMGHIILPPPEGRHTEDFPDARKTQRLRPSLNPRTWVPVASMLTTRPPKPSSVQYARGISTNAELIILLIILLNLILGGTTDFFVDFSIHF